MKTKIIAYYLPQFHPIPENDQWWGKGFTEWTNVGKARPLFKGHYQPRVPADLGYYDLRVSETREAQALLAKRYGIYGFCYWHYWFGNQVQLLEKPFNEVLSTGKPDYPFCLAWANESWKGFDHGLSGRRELIEQLYPGIDDYEKHFDSVLPAFLDKRYIYVHNKPLFVLYHPLADTELKTFIQVWRKKAIEHGLAGIYFVGINCSPNIDKTTLFDKIDIDAINSIRLEDFYGKTPTTSIVNMIKRKLLKFSSNSLPSHLYDYAEVSQYFVNPQDKLNNVFPSIISGWDHSPRTGENGLILNNYTPKL